MLKAGKIYLENGKTEDACFLFEEGTTIDVLTEYGYLVLRIDPDELLAIADAIRGQRFEKAYAAGLKIKGLS